MKNLILIPTLVLATVFTGCTGDDITPTAGVINCNLDGSTWESSEAYAAVSEGLINISGLKDGNLLTITIDNDTEGEYDLGEGSGNAAAYNLSGAANSYVSHIPKGKGTISVTEIDNVNETVSGTFEFTAILSNDDGEKLKIKNGHFEKIPFNVAPGETDSELTAKVNGDDFDATYVFAGNSFDRISISANIGGSMPTIGLSFPDDLSPGSYTTSLFGDFRAQYVTDGEDISGASGGDITVTSHDTDANKMIGTFEFVDEEFDVTDGEFTIYY
jgi:hypothetical protein